MMTWDIVCKTCGIEAVYHCECHKEPYCMDHLIEHYHQKERTRSE